MTRVLAPSQRSCLIMKELRHTNPNPAILSIIIPLSRGRGYL